MPFTVELEILFSFYKDKMGDPFCIQFLECISINLNMIFYICKENKYSLSFDILIL